jgi:tetratricopeptide (TPR) repeat protein
MARPTLRSTLTAAFPPTLLGVLAALLAVHPIFSVDLFWHLELGEIIAAERAIPDVDRFSAVHPDAPWVQFQWLWDALAFGVVDVFGLLGLRLALALLAAVTFSALYLVTRRRLGASEAFTLSAITLLLFEDRFRARPDATTLVFVVATLPWLLDGFPRRPRGLAALFALGALWSNVHGGAALLLVLFAGASAISAAFDRQIDARARAVRLGGVLAALLGFVASPTTVPGLIDWASIVAPMMEVGNPEWEPTWTMARYADTPALWLVAIGPTIVTLAYGLEQWRRVRGSARLTPLIGEWLLAGGCLVLAHHAVRNAYLCFVPLAFLFRRVKVPRGVHFVVAAIVLGLTIHDGVMHGYGGPTEAIEIAPDYDLAPGTYPEEAGDFLARAAIEGPILNEGRWGGYLIWRCYPRCRVFVDTRHHLTSEMWRIFRRSNDPLSRLGAMDEAFSRYGIGLAVFEGPTFPLVTPPPTWELLFKAGPQEVYQRVDHPEAAHNRARAAAELARIGRSVAGELRPHSLDRIAVLAGADVWLSRPWQRRRLAEAARDIATEDEAVQARGYALRGGLLHQAGLRARARPDLERAVELDPTRARAWYDLAFVRFLDGEHEAAVRALRHLTELPPGQLSAERMRIAEHLRRVLLAR